MTIDLAKLEPMLAARKYLPKYNKYPCFIQPKIDGFRCVIADGIAFSRSLKPFRNKHVQAWAKANRSVLEGLDGELVVGDPTHPDTFNKTSAVNAFDTKVEFLLCVYDAWNLDLGYAGRFHTISNMMKVSDLPGNVRLCPTYIVENEEQILEYEERFIKLKYEGAILRGMNAPYKHGRPTEREFYTTKIKRFEDDEAQVTGWEPRFRNDNAQFRDERGYAKRSSHQENLVPLDMLGAWITEWTDKNGKKHELRIGSGFDHDQAARWYREGPDKRKGEWITFKYFTPGMKDVPRHPIYKGFRERGT